jgi:hypothetical protein
MRNVSTQDARNKYGNRGHEIVELDGWTGWMVKNTVEDCLSFGGYNTEWHIGRLPEVAQQENIVMRDKATNNILLQADVPITRFYS